MEGVKEKQGQLVFGLDIGTRSIVGTVGYLNGGKFHVLAQRSKEHETRAMLDGQIHDIGKVGETISQVKEQLEADLGRELTEVCIAAAGRVLRTVTTYVEHSFESDREITQEDVYSLCTMGVEKAYEEFQNSNTDTDMKFYCVGYTAMRYYMNGYQMGNLEGHKAKNIAVDLIATFLPDDVVDGLYKAVELAGRLRGLNCHINLIPLNEVKERSCSRSRQTDIERFKKILEKQGMNVTIRREMGSDIDAACGQLRQNYMNEETK